MGAVGTGYGSSSTDTYLHLSGSCHRFPWRISQCFHVFCQCFSLHHISKVKKITGYKCQLELVGANPVSDLLSVHMVTEVGCPELHLCWVFSVQLEVVKVLK